MRKMVFLLVVLFALMPTIAAEAQTMEAEKITAFSWQKGNEKVFDQTLRITLNSTHREYSTEILSTSGKKYKLNIIHNPIMNVSTEHWKIELRKVTQVKMRKEALSDNLLQAEPSSLDKHYFPREDFAGYIYPEKEPPVVRVGGTPFFEGFPFYPLKAIREIKVEGFYLTIKVKDYRFSRTDKKQLDYLDLTIEFHNAC